MTKLEIEAIRALPEEYVRDATEVALVNGVPCALNPLLLPMLYRGGKWEKLDTSHCQAVEIVAESVTSLTARRGDDSSEATELLAERRARALRAFWRRYEPLPPQRR
jgi:hypothetical protein